MTEAIDSFEQQTELLSQLLKEIDHHVARSIDDISQTKLVLDQAIIKLDTNFNSIYRAITNDEALEDTFQGTLSSVNNAIVALQFHDLTTQLMDRSLMRLESLRTTLLSLEELNTTETLYGDAYTTQLTQVVNALSHLSEKLHKAFNQSLEQIDMECGDVELF